MTLQDCYNGFIARLNQYKYDTSHINISFDWFLVFRKRTQAQKMWWHLKTFKKITSAGAEDIYHFRHPPSIIRDIRKKLKCEGADYQISNETKIGYDWWGNSCKYDEYTLEEL